jgi:hypothetical protein
MHAVPRHITLSIEFGEASSGATVHKQEMDMEDHLLLFRTAA